MGKAGAWAKCMSAVMHGSTGYRAGMAQWGRPARERSACARRVQSVYGACCELGRAGTVCKVGEFAI